MLYGLGKDKAEIAYLLMHLAYCFITMVFAYLSWYSHFLNTLFLITWTVWSIWNGSCFYMEKFAQMYEVSLKRLEEVEAQFEQDNITEQE